MSSSYIGILLVLFFDTVSLNTYVFLILSPITWWNLYIFDMYINIFDYIYIKMNIIVAMCKNRGIGYRGTIPWSLKEDMRFFRNKTIGYGNNAVVMGRKTYDSIPVELPKRK